MTPRSPGISGSLLPPFLHPETPRQNPRGLSPPSSPEPGDRYLKLEGANNAPEGTPILGLCFLFNFPTNTLFYHPKP